MKSFGECNGGEMGEFLGTGARKFIDFDVPLDEIMGRSCERKERNVVVIQLRLGGKKASWGLNS